MVDREDFVMDYEWTVTIAPLAGALGILPCAFFARKLGPRKTMILQTPLNLIFWFLLGYYDNLEIYNVSRFFVAFFSATYCYCGEELLVESVHRKYLKITYAMYRASLFLGVMAMNVLGPLLDKYILCICCASCVCVTFLLLFSLPESPVYLMRTNPLKAKLAYKWYRGEKANRTELDIIASYVHFLKNQTTGFIPMFKTKVVIKAVKICSILFLLKCFTGYYIFLIDSPKWFTEDVACVSPYIDNIIFSMFLVIARFIGILVHLYGTFGVRRGLLISLFLMSAILAILGYYKFILLNIATNKMEGCVTLPSLCLYVFAYECGISIAPEMTLYDYLPFQIYNTVKKIMLTLMWFMIFLVLRIYMYLLTYKLYATLWMLALIMFAGYVFIIFAVIESRGKSLLQIQIELGGNPIGTRGSRRQRIATPMDNVNTDAQLREMIKKHYTELLEESVA